MSKPVVSTGAQFKRFYADPAAWHPDENSEWFVEEMTLRVNDQEVDEPGDAFGDDLERLPDHAQVEVSGGWMGWQGQGPDPTRGDGKSLGETFGLWLQAQTTLTLVATLELPADTPPESLAKVVAQLTALGATVQGLPEAPARKPGGTGP